MKKFVMGLIIGFVISLSIPAMADSIIGKKVTNEISVYINGTKSSDSAIVVDNRSYLPVRSFAEALGNSVEFKGGDVMVSSEDVVENTEIATEETVESRQKITAIRLNFINSFGKEVVEKTPTINIDTNYYFPFPVYNLKYKMNSDGSSTVYIQGKNSITLYRGIDEDGIKYQGGYYFIRPDIVGMTLTQEGDTYYLR